MEILIATKAILERSRWAVQGKNDIDIYGGKAPGDVPFYSVGEAARCLRLPGTTVRDWVQGRPYPTSSGPAESLPLIDPADSMKPLLSFRNLVELHVVSSIRYIHKVKLSAIRDAIRYLRDELNSEHPLLDYKMLTDGKDLFVERYGQLINATQQGQMQIRDVLDQYLKRIERDELGIPVRLFPYSRPKAEERSPRLISIDPRIRFGRPCIAGTNLPTSIIAERYAAGESIQFLVADYGREAKEIEEAIHYESRIAS
jgi:uncharacterized protein (DUF433 family)